MYTLTALIHSSISFPSSSKIWDTKSGSLSWVPVRPCAKVSLWETRQMKGTEISARMLGWEPYADASTNVNCPMSCRQLESVIVPVNFSPSTLGNRETKARRLTRLNNLHLREKQLPVAVAKHNWPVFILLPTAVVGFDVFNAYNHYGHVSLHSINRYTPPFDQDLEIRHAPTTRHEK